MRVLSKLLTNFSSVLTKQSGFLPCSRSLNIISASKVKTSSSSTTYIQFRSNHIKSAVLKEFGDKLEITELKAQKKLKDQEVRVKVHCCAVNVTDYLVCSGNYTIKPKLPFVPGYEFSGDVTECGSKVKGLSKGDRVIGLNRDLFSSMSEECIAPCQNLWKIPQDMAYETAASLTESYTTVLIGARRVNLTEGEAVLVTAASGGIGLAAVDIAAHLYKAKVIAACDTEDKASLLREKGAFSAVNYSKKEMMEAVMTATNNVGVQVVFDAVGGDVFEHCLHSVAPEGSIVFLGFASRMTPEIATSKLLPSSCAIIGISLTHYQKMKNDIYRHTVQEVIDMYLDDFIEPQIAASFKLEDVNDAFKFIEEKKSTGKVIVNIQ